MTTQSPVLPPADAAPAATTIDFETTKEVGYYHLVWRRFKQRKIAYIAAITMVVLVVSCYVLPIFLPADCPDLTQTDLGPFTVGHSSNPICGVGSLPPAGPAYVRGPQGVPSSAPGTPHVTDVACPARPNPSNCSRA